MRIIILLSSVFTCFSVQSQDLITDRPDATESANVLAVGEIQSEIGYNSDRINWEEFGNSGKTNTSGVGSLIRIGFFKSAELRFISEYVDFHNEFNGMKENISGFSSFTLGTKLKLLDDEANGLQIAFLGHLSIPDSGKKEFSTDNAGSDFRISIAKDLTDKVSLGMNLAMEWVGDSPAQTSL